MLRVRMSDGVRELELKRVRVEGLLRLLCVNPEDVLVLREGRLLTEDVWLSDGDEVEIYEVVSRG